MRLTEDAEETWRGNGRWTFEGGMFTLGGDGQSFFTDPSEIHLIQFEKKGNPRST